MGESSLKGVNLVKKHVRPNPQRKIEGGIVQKEASIHISNVAFLNSTSNQPDRVGFKWVGEAGNKRKVRFFNLIMKSLIDSRAMSTLQTFICRKINS